MIEVEKKFKVDSPEQYDRIYQALLGKGFTTKYHRNIESYYHNTASGVLRLCYCLEDISGNSPQVILLNTKEGRGEARYESEIEIPEPMAKVLREVAFSNPLTTIKAVKNRLCMESTRFEIEVCLDEVLEPENGIGPWFCEIEKLVESPGEVPTALRHLKNWCRNLGLVNEETRSYYEMLQEYVFKCSTY